MVTATVLGALLLAYPLQDGPAASIGLAEPYVYVPSDITKANPNIRVAGGHGSWSTTNISDVTDYVKYTIRGTISEIRDPVDWYVYDNAIAGMASIPVVMSVEEVYKGRFGSDTITFFLGAFIFYPDIVSLDATIADTVGSRKEYLIPGFEPQFEIGDHVLVHIYEAPPSFLDDKIITPQDRAVLTPYYNIKLAKYGAYHVHGDRIYNDVIPEGAPISRAINESQPVG